MKRPRDLDALLAHAQWLRGLASALAQPGTDADDLVQQTWLSALRAPPDPGRPARPWLAEVLRNVRRMAGRSDVRRRLREDVAGPERLPAESAQDVLERAEAQRRIADLVMALEEPYRTAILLRYFEGRLAKDIARALGVPAGTVRWRITEGLSRLRARIEQQAGDTHRARAWFAAVAGAPAPAARRVEPGFPLPAPGLAAAGVLAVLVVSGGGVALWSTARTRAAGPRPEHPVSATAASKPSPASVNAKEETEMKKKLKSAALLVGAALPALVASAESGGREVTRDEHTAFCVRRWERMAACKEEFADYFASKRPPEQRQTARSRFIEAALRAGTGPIEPRRQGCAESVDRVGPLTAADVERLDACLAKPDCAAVVTCMKPSLDQAQPKKP